jgi:tetratricopeptide (TPR) repeat protein
MTDALTLAARSGEMRLVGMLQQNLGIVADMRGNPVAALAHYRVSLRTFEATNDLQPMAWVLNNLGYLHVKEQRYDEAQEAFDRALDIARSRGDLMSEGIIEENRAELKLVLGQVDEAEPSIARALQIAEQRNDDVRRGAALKLRGAYERLAGHPARAVDILKRALSLSAAGEDALLGAEILYQFGLALYSLGDADGARVAWKTSLEAFERISARQWIGRVHRQLTAGMSGRYL